MTPRLFLLFLVAIPSLVKTESKHWRKTTPKKESKGKDMDSLHNYVLLDQATYDKLNKKVNRSEHSPKFR
uniref:40S ribosomal protein S25 n=1 Tax=Caenorhabditis japonica TaxID=281687 RepID=A0A8R1E6A2_CAEJA